MRVVRLTESTAACEGLAVSAKHRCHHPQEGGALGGLDRTDLAEVDQAEPLALEGNEVARMRVGVESIGLEDHHSVGLQDRPSEPSSINPNLFQSLPDC